MTGRRETYTPGYSESTLRLMFKRTAAKNAALAQFKIDSKYLPGRDQLGQINRYGSGTTAAVQ